MLEQSGTVDGLGFKNKSVMICAMQNQAVAQCCPHEALHLFIAPPTGVVEDFH